MPRRPKAEHVIVQRLDHVTCTQWVRATGTCGVLIWFMPGELPQRCALGHYQPWRTTMVSQPRKKVIAKTPVQEA